MYIFDCSDSYGFPVYSYEILVKTYKPEGYTLQNSRNETFCLQMWNSNKSTVLIHVLIRYFVFMCNVG